MDSAETRQIRRTSDIVEVVESAAEAVIEHCGTCSNVLPDKAAFCIRCGESQRVAEAVELCRKCGNELLDGAAFCMVCGHQQVFMPEEDQILEMPRLQMEQEMVQLQRENAEIRAHLQAQDLLGEGVCAADLAELASISVHVQAPIDEQVEAAAFSALPVMMDGTQAADQDPISQRLQRERVVLLRDLNSVKAKFALSLQTLRAALGLDAEATWADLLEHVEALGKGHLPSNQSLPEVDAEAEDAELEREQLEDKVEAQSGHITRLRELLQKQQRLLDMTAGQIHDQHQQGKLETEKVLASEQLQERQQEINEAQGAEIEALTSRLREEIEHSEQLREEFQMLRNHSSGFEEQLRVEAQARQREFDRIVETREQLAAKDLDIKRHRADVARQKQVIKELTDGLAAQNQSYEVMREKMEVCDAEQRRWRSYQARTPRPRSSTDEVSSPGDLTNMSDISARGPGGVATSFGLRSVGGMQGSMDMDDEERDAFLSHFPMAQRTERQFRHRMEADRRKKVGQR